MFAEAAAFEHHDLPWAFFREDQESLGSIITCVGIIVPEKVYNHVPNYMSGNLANSDNGEYILTPFEYKLFDLIDKTSLAR